MSTQNSIREIGITLHLNPQWVERLDPATTYDHIPGQPYTVLRFGDFAFHFHNADDLERLHVLVQNAVIRQQMAEAKARRETEGAAQ